MFGSLGLRKMGAASQDLAVDDLEAKIQPGALFAGRFVGSREPVPGRGKQFFNHKCSWKRDRCRSSHHSRTQKFFATIPPWPLLLPLVRAQITAAETPSAAVMLAME